MTPEEHRQEHVRLHNELDQLLACYLSDSASLIEGRRSIHDELIKFLQWSHEKTMKPTPVPEDRHKDADSRSSSDFECRRQMLVLALAELALSRPGWDHSIREIVRNYDDEKLSMFESFKASNADRVKATHGDLGASGAKS